MSEKPSQIIRNYEPRDREAVRGLCCDTGYLGSPIDPVFEDRELFADYLTSYYTDIEPESSFVVEQDGVVKGYLLGSRFPKKQAEYDRKMLVGLVLRGLGRYPRYHRASRAYVRWILFRSWREVPEAPKGMPHFHFNLRPEVQSIGGTRELIDRYVNYLSAAGEKSVFGQVVTFESKRGARLFERYGFTVHSRQEITKYRKVHPEPVYLTTIIRELDGSGFHSVKMAT